MNAKLKERIVLLIIGVLLAYVVYLCAEDFFNEIFSGIFDFISGIFTMDEVDTIEKAISDEFFANN